jgi:epidermal growth factor receptor substrate 15
MSGAQQPWDVTPGAKATSDRFFTTLDPQDKGFIEGDVAVPFMLQSQLDEGVLASIWDLADIRQEGKLSRDEFAVAMHLINTKLAGQDIPASLPNSLIPPSLRAEYGSGTQEVLSPGTGSTAKDLFDLFDDSSAPPAPAHAAPTPPPAQPFTTAFLQQPPSRKPTATPGSRQMSPAPSAPASGFGMAPFGMSGYISLLTFSSSCRQRPPRRRRGGSSPRGTR